MSMNQDCQSVRGVDSRRITVTGNVSKQDGNIYENMAFSPDQEISRIPEPSPTTKIVKKKLTKLQIAFVCAIILNFLLAISGIVLLFQIFPYGKGQEMDKSTHNLLQAIEEQCNDTVIKLEWKTSETKTELINVNSQLSQLRNKQSEIKSSFAATESQLSRLRDVQSEMGRNLTEGLKRIAALPAIASNVKSQLSRMESQLSLLRNVQSEMGRNLTEGLKRIAALPVIAPKLLRIPADCSNNSGVTQIFPKTFPNGTGVYCDTTTDDGNWIVFQRRQDGSVNFNRNWTDYVDGFGSLRGEYWMGLEKLHRLMDDGDYELRIDLGDWDGNRRYAKYSTFSVCGPSGNYRLRVAGYSGTAGDSMLQSGSHLHDNQQFSARDRDNDASPSSCSQLYNGGWWFNSCFDAHLNGIYHDERTEEKAEWQGIIWNEWKGSRYSLKFTEMIFRKKQN